MDRLERVQKGLSCIAGTGECLGDDKYGDGCGQCMMEIAKEANLLLARANEIIQDEVIVPEYMKYVN